MSLLIHNEVERVAFVSDSAPLILPVNYILDGNTIVIRTDQGQKLAEIPMRHVAFEIDSGNESDAWSVLVRGFAREITGALARASRRLRGSAAIADEQTMSAQRRAAHPELP